MSLLKIKQTEWILVHQEILDETSDTRRELDYEGKDWKLGYNLEAAKLKEDAYEYLRGLSEAVTEDYFLEEDFEYFRNQICELRGRLQEAYYFTEIPSLRLNVIQKTMELIEELEGDIHLAM